MPPRRALAPLESNSLIIGWKCEGCEWVFPLKHPRSLDDYTNESMKIIQAAFDVHTCEAWTTAHGIVPDRD